MSLALLKMQTVIKAIPPLSEDFTVEPLVEFIKTIRPQKPTDSVTAEENLKTAIAYFQKNTTEAALFSGYILQFIQQKDKTSLLTDVGILSSSGFRRELKQRFNYFLLPEAKDNNSLRFYLEDVFYKDTDYLWVKAIDTNLWVQFFDTINFKAHSNNEVIESIEQAIIDALKVLSYRIAAIGLDQTV